MGLPGDREAEEFVRSKDVDPENARYALEVCIRMAKQAVSELEAVLEEQATKSPSELISEYAESLTFPDDLPGGAELEGLELRAVYRDGTRQVIARQDLDEPLEEGEELSVAFDLVVKPPADKVVTDFGLQTVFDQHKPQYQPIWNDPNTVNPNSGGLYGGIISSATANQFTVNLTSSTVSAHNTLNTLIGQLENQEKTLTGLREAIKQETPK